MKKWVSRILAPAVLVAAAAVQSFGVDAGRALHLQSFLTPETSVQDPDSLEFKPLERPVLSHEDSLSMQRADSLRMSRDRFYIDSIRAQIDSFGYDYLDSVVLARLDSLEAIYAEPVFNPADTIRIPEGLELTDPFKYRYYIAIKDTATLRHTRDSLRAIPDSAELARLDSLYFKDSTEVARWKEQVYYNSLSRSERKRYDAEKALPGKIHRIDSILNRKDSIKAHKDSVKEATPRILDTYIVPDSLQYKRILLWTHVPAVNEVKLQKVDTSYNYNFYDYPFYKEDVEVTYLGISGSAVQNNNFFKRHEEDNVPFYSPYQVYSYSPETLPQYNTKTPFTELCYWGTLFTNQKKEESNIRVRTTQNITPNLNLHLEYHRYGGKGLLQNESTDNRTAVVSTNYAGKRYLMHAGYIYNKVGRGENGGAVDQVGDFNWIKDTTVTDVREIDVYLTKASSLMKKHTFFLDQSYRIPFSFLAGRKERKAEKIYKDSLMTYGDSVEIAEYLAWEAEQINPIDTMYKDVTSAFFGHSSELSMFRRTYDDEIGMSDKHGREFYEHYFLHPTTSADSMRVMRLDNKVYMRLQPWKADGVVSKIDVGIGDKLNQFYDFNPDSYLGAKSNVVYNNVYAYAGVQGQFRKYIHWDADGKYTFLGHEINDFSVGANLDVNFYPFRRHKDSPLNLNAHFETSLKEPAFYEQHVHTNHFFWDNDFRKISTTKVQAGLDIPRWKLEAGFGYAMLTNNIYYDNKAIVQQNQDLMSVITATLRKDFSLWKVLHLDNSALLQFSSRPDVVPLPLLSLNLRYYVQFDVVKNVMQMQLGANAFFTTKWNMPGYNPVLGVFYNQDEAKYGNCPYIDAFVNVQWKNACVFLKVVNVNMGKPFEETDYFSAHHYIKPVRALKFGIYWPFYVQPGSGHSHNHGTGNSSTGSNRGGGNAGGGNRGGSGPGGMARLNNR